MATWGPRQLMGGIRSTAQCVAESRKERRLVADWLWERGRDRFAFSSDSLLSTCSASSAGATLRCGKRGCDAWVMTLFSAGSGARLPGFRRPRLLAGSMSK
jgi:hypothetical protein